LQEHNVYPVTENLLNSEFSTRININESVGVGTNDFTKSSFLNITPTSIYLDLETYVINTSAQPLFIWFCNSSYTTGLVTNSPNCVNFLTLNPSNYSHCHSEKNCHYVLPINKNTSSVMGVGITNKIYILLQGGYGWNYFYLNNDTTSFEKTTNGGNAWTTYARTQNMHIHQYNNDTLYYYASDGNITSSVRTDNIDVTPLPPSSVIVYSPISRTYDHEMIFINYSQSISNYANITNYKINMLNIDFSLNVTLITNNYTKLNHTINSTSFGNSSYIVQVIANDTYGMTTSGYSANFTIFNYDAPLPKTTAESIDEFTNNFLYLSLILFGVICYFLSTIAFSSDSSGQITGSFLLKGFSAFCMEGLISMLLQCLLLMAGCSFS